MYWATNTGTLLQQFNNAHWKWLRAKPNSAAKRAALREMYRCQSALIAAGAVPGSGVLNETHSNSIKLTDGTTGNGRSTAHVLRLPNTTAWDNITGTRGYWDPNAQRWVPYYYYENTRATGKRKPATAGVHYDPG